MKRLLFTLILLAIFVVAVATIFSVIYKDRVVSKFESFLAQHVNNGVELNLKVNFIKYFPKVSLSIDLDTKNISYTHNHITYINGADIHSTIDGFYNNKTASFEILNGTLSIDKSVFDIEGVLNIENPNTPLCNLSFSTDNGYFTILNNKNSLSENISFRGVIGVTTNSNSINIVPNLDYAKYRNIEADNLNATILITPNSWNVENGECSILGSNILFELSDKIPSDRMQINLTAEGADMNISEIAAYTPIANTLFPLSNYINSPIDFKLNIACEADSLQDIVISSINGSGEIHCNSITLPESKELQSILAFFQSDKDKGITTTITNLDIFFNVANEKIVIQPFNTSMGDIQLSVSGNHGFNGALDYNIKAEMERENLNSSVNSVLNLVSDYASMFGISISAANKPISLSIHIGGTKDSPILSF